MKIKCALILASVIYTLPATAAMYTCTGKIDGINQPYSGEVSIVSMALYGNGGGRTICNLSQPYTKGGLTVSPDTCKAWLAKLLSAQARQASLTIQYNDSLSNCNSQSVWGDASIPWSMWE